MLRGGGRLSHTSAAGSAAPYRFGLSFFWPLTAITPPSGTIQFTATVDRDRGDSPQRWATARGRKPAPARCPSFPFVLVVSQEWVSSPAGRSSTVVRLGPVWLPIPALPLFRFRLHSIRYCPSPSSSIRNLPWKRSSPPLVPRTTEPHVEPAEKPLGRAAPKTARRPRLAPLCRRWNRSLAELNPRRSDWTAPPRRTDSSRARLGRYVRGIKTRLNGQNPAPQKKQPPAGPAKDRAPRCARRKAARPSRPEDRAAAPPRPAVWRWDRSLAELNPGPSE